MRQIYRRIAIFILVGLACALPRAAAAHPKAIAVREIVRLRGTVAAAEGTCASDAIEVRVLGKATHLCDGNVRRIVVAAGETADAAATPASFDLQGEREHLAEITAAAPGTRVYLIGEWRPGRRDLFLIDYDLYAGP